MTDILVQWLNDDLKLSKSIDQTSFAKDFASGFLIGEVLSKYQLQNDFDQFSQSKTNDSKLNNFTRLEPIFHLLGIPFDTNVAREIMTEKHGVATRIMYQLYIALNKKKKANLTGVAMETMRPAAPAKLNTIESTMYKERLKHLTPRQTDLNLQRVSTRFQEKQLEMEKVAFRERFEEQERLRQERQETRMKLIERSRLMQQKQSELVAKIQAATVHIPKPPANKTDKAIQMRMEIRKNLEAKEMIAGISAFEEKMKMMLPPSHFDEEASEDIDLQYILTRDEDKMMYDKGDFIRPKSNDEYINKIRKRLQEDAHAREEREKRRRKVLVDQMNAHEAQEEARREEMMVNRLMRQSQQERRISVQLLQARHEKDVIRRNRIFREKQFEERRLQDFQDALNREAELARLARLEYMEQTRKDQELHDKIAAERAEQKYKRHYDLCEGVVEQIIDFASKVGEYRELTNKLLPPKLMREWTALFVSGLPLFETKAVESAEMTPEQLLEEERQLLLDEGDFSEYKTMIGEWQPPEHINIKGPPRDNPILGHMVQRILNMVHPPTPPLGKPEFPPFPIKACILGKVFSGKTTCIQKLLDEHRLQVLVVDMLVNQAVEAHQNGEVVEMPSTADVREGEISQASATTTTGMNPPSDGTGTAVPSTPAEAETTAPALPPLTTVAEGGAEGGADGAVDTSSTAPSADQPTGDTSSAPPATPLDASSISLRADSQRKKRASKMSTPEETGPQPTERARLGAKALRCLKKGKPVDDQIIVDILVEAIRQVPEGTGWVIDGFPQNYNQAKLLEKGLSGFDANAKEAPAKPAKNQPRRKSSLVPDPRPPPPPPEPTSGIDVVIVFDVDDSVCLKRAAGRSYAIQADEQYHQEFKPPPEGSATGIGKQEQVIPVQDAAHDQEQIQHRITGFHDSWGKLEKWFTRFGTLRRVDAAQNEDAVFLETEKILEDTVAKLQAKDLPPEPETTETKTEEVVEEKPPEPAPEPEPETPKEPESEKEESPSTPKSGKESGRKTRSSSKEKRSKSASSKKSEKSQDGKGKAAKGGKKSKTPEPEPEPEPEVPAGPPPPEPGSAEWEFVDMPIEMDLAKILADYWETVENTYVDNAKTVFRNVRKEREDIYRYFFKIRKDFLEYLRRPDHKQEFVEAWQKEYNRVPDDMRDDEETRAELHQRVDDLRERLWSICDERKEQAEKERENIMGDGWLDDHMGVLANHYITLMQAEVDRYQDTVRMMKDYYRGMDGQIPDELCTTYARIPLVELPVRRADSPDMEAVVKEIIAATPSVPDVANSDRSKSPKDRQKAESPKSPKDKSPKSPKDQKNSRSPSAKQKKGAEPEPEVERKKVDISELLTSTKIPLVPRRPVSPDPDSKPGTTKGKDVKGKATGKKSGVEDGMGADSPMPPADPDEKLVYDAAQNGIVALREILNAEFAAREAEEEAEKLLELEKEKERDRLKAAQKKGGGGKKGGKSRSPSPKKGKGGGKEPEAAAPTPQPEEEEESEEEKQKKLTKKRMREEYYFCIQEEEQASRVRLDLIRMMGIAILQDLRDKADNAFKDLNDWLGARFLKEMESIDHLSEIMRSAIETRQKIKYELVLQQEDFLVNEDFAVLKSPSPEPPPPPEEQAVPDLFTVQQLLSFYNQFAKTAPSGIMSNRSFVETFENIVAVTHGMEQLPDSWMNIQPSQISELEQSLSAGGEYVDWRRLLVALTEPIPVPTQTELLGTLTRFKEMDQKDTGYVTREQYDRMNLWFPTDVTPPGTFNRVASLKKSLFDMFSDQTKDPVVLDYTSMLMYFAAAPSPLHGFLRALSVASGQHMPRLEKLQPISTQLGQGDEDGLPEMGELDDKLKLISQPAAINEDIPPEAIDATVPLIALFKVLHHGEGNHGDSHRFSLAADPEEATSWDRLAAVYMELGSEDLEPLPYRMLVEHPLIQDIITACKTFTSLDVKAILSAPAQDNADAHSTKTGD